MIDISARYDTNFWPSCEAAQEALRVALHIKTIILAHVPNEAKPTQQTQEL